MNEKQWCDKEWGILMDAEKPMKRNEKFTFAPRRNIISK